MNLIKTYFAYLAAIAALAKVWQRNVSVRFHRPASP